MGIQKQKISWEEIFQEFSKKHTNLKGKIVKWEPYYWMKIKIILNDGRQILYDHSTGSTEFFGIKFL